MNRKLAPVYRFCASTAQRRLWQRHQQDPRLAPAHCSALMHVHGPLNCAGLERSLAVVVQRHEALRTVFSWEDNELVQWIDEGMQIPLELIDLSSLAGSALPRGLQMARQRADELFDLSRGPLLRVCLIQLGEDQHLLLLTAHPSVADHPSMRILCQEWSQIHNAGGLTADATLPPLEVQLADVCVWQHQRMQTPAIRDLLNSAREDYRERPWTLELPRTDVASTAASAQVGVVEWQADPSILTLLEQIATRHNSNLDGVLTAAFNAVLYRYSQQNEICLGFATPNRRHAQTQGLIGGLANTLIMRTVLSDGVSLEEAVSLTREARLKAEEFPDIDLAHLLAASATEADGTLENGLSATFERRDPARLALTGVAVEGLPFASQTIDCDLKLVVYSHPTRLAGCFEYAAEHFTDVTLQRMARHFEAALQALALTPHSRIEQWPLAPAGCASLSTNEDLTAFSEHQQLPVFRRFAAQAARTPEAIALIFEQQSCTYAQLNRQANQLAAHLHSLGVGSQSVVALLVERGPRLVSSLLAILKVGAAYLPLDAMYPAQRISNMFEDAGVSLIITSAALLEHLPESPLPLVCLDQQNEQLARQPLSDPDIAVSPQQLAYCLFTSGSTGRPKGVQIEHRALSNLLAAMEAAPGLGPDDVWLSVTSAAFDIFAVEVYLPLITGATLLLASKEEAADPSALARLAQVHGATVLQATPATWRMLIDSQVSMSLRTAMSGGEAMDTALAEGMRSLAKTVWNLYGPTETTIYSSRTKILSGHLPTLGGPVENTRLYVLDRHLNPLPVGCTGEIHIGGDGLARGYINRPDLTAERFLPDPFGPPGSRMYRTGDLARQLPNGDLVYLDRIDFQVKIRGLRIELGEIEAALRRIADVRQAVVTAHGEETASRKLVAYVVARPGHTLDREALAHELQQSVPDYMVPGLWVFLEKLPLNVSGKIDRSRLPAPPRTSAIDARPNPEVLSDSQARLAAIWAQTLQIADVALQDNFFALGGNSMLAIRCLVRINSEFDKQLSLRTFFEHQTVAALDLHLQIQAQPNAVEQVRMTTWFSQPDLPDVYGFSGCGMHGAAYFPLARALAPVCNFHALEPLEPESPDGQLVTVQALAQRYAEAIISHRKTTPITLVGHSFGGSLAFETARLLEQRSLSVRLILLDATLVDPCLLEREAGIAAPADRLPEWLAIAPELPGGQIAEDDLLASARTLYLQHCRIFAAYVPSGILRAPVTALLAEQALLLQKLRAGFLRVCAQRLLAPPVLHSVPGDHMSMLAPPHVEVVAARISHELHQPATAPARAAMAHDSA
ncbi:amino acid adenylation domain-containing protein [Pseudomonas helmanticensis]|uniref:Amino acid adenylation domain-containing protein n=1 Tax=Pseudomonas helmanticensis TaxID=1471381 RepID=A0ACD2U2G7_9PSED|nr:amino acid adenylation domain-containing protein [Pseudomonas helmanticensis]SMQ23682.1 amino acid adenylation domain-containing protein [Pseudomonas helmanticensis]